MYNWTMKRLFWILLLFLFACSPAKSLQKETHVFLPESDRNGEMVLLMNTEVRIITADPDKKEELIATADPLLREYSRLADRFHEYESEGTLLNNLKVINDHYGQGPVRTDERLIAMLERSIELAELSEGAFNPTVGLLSDLWSPLFNGAENSDPDEQEVQECLSCVIPYDQLRDYIVLDQENDTVSFREYPGCGQRVILDLGAFSKGYILQEVHEALLPYDTSFLLDAGSSSIITHTAEGEDIHWNIGVRSPQSGEVLYALYADDIALSTSADDQQFFFNEEGIRRHHILDPASGYPRDIFRGITLCAATDAGTLDALSTALWNIDDPALQEEILQKSGLTAERALIREGEEKLQLLLDPGISERLIPELQSEEAEILLMN